MTAASGGDEPVIRRAVTGDLVARFPELVEWSVCRWCAAVIARQGGTQARRTWLHPEAGIEAYAACGAGGTAAAPVQRDGQDVYVTVAGSQPGVDEGLDAVLNEILSVAREWSGPLYGVFVAGRLAGWEETHERAWLAAVDMRDARNLPDLPDTGPLCPVQLGADPALCDADDHSHDPVDVDARLAAAALARRAARTVAILPEDLSEFRAVR